jgi:hypothetical protein
LRATGRRNELSSTTYDHVLMGIVVASVGMLGRILPKLPAQTAVAIKKQGTLLGGGLLIVEILIVGQRFRLV